MGKVLIVMDVKGSDLRAFLSFLGTKSGASCGFWKLYWVRGSILRVKIAGASFKERRLHMVTEEGERTDKTWQTPDISRRLICGEQTCQRGERVTFGVYIEEEVQNMVALSVPP